MSEVTTSVEKLLRNGEVVGISTKGNSMLPLMKGGKTQVIVEPVNRELSIGEMPVYMRKDGAYILHRVVDMDENYYYIRGDNCVTLERVPKGNVLGVATELRRNGRIIRPTDWHYRLYVRILFATTTPRIQILRLRAKAGKIYRKYIKRRTE